MGTRTGTAPLAGKLSWKEDCTVTVSAVEGCEHGGDATLTHQTDVSIQLFVTNCVRYHEGQCGKRVPD